jgi:hypothetical protein
MIINHHRIKRLNRIIKYENYPNLNGIKVSLCNNINIQVSIIEEWNNNNPINQR